MRRPSCSLLEARTEVLQEESDVNVDESSYEVSGMRNAAAACALHTGNCRKGQCAKRRDRDEFNQTKKAPPWGRAGMRSEPGHTWGGSAQTGQRLQEPALLGLPVYEAHWSWQLPGLCRAAIFMSAARNRIRHLPALLLARAGSSLRRAVTTHFAAVFATQDAAAILWPALPALRCLQRSSRRSAFCGC